MRVNVAIPEADVSKPVLDAALEAVTRLNEQLIDKGHPTFSQALPHGIKWKPEPPGAEHFDHAGIVAERGWGDCDDLAPWHAASLRKTGQDPGATAIVQRSGPNRWHAVVQRSDGTIDDPSRAAGMGQPGSLNGIHGAVLPLMNAPADVSGTFVARPSLALRPAPQGWQARIDLPWHWRERLDEDPSPTDYAMAALHTAPVAPTALVGALDGAIVLGEASGIAHPDHLERLRCFADACEGMPYPDLVAVYGEENAMAAHQVVGSIFSKLAHIVTAPVKAVANVATAPVKAAARFVQHPSLSNLTHMVTDPLRATAHAAQPLTSFAKPFMPAMRFIPGIGPVASTAFDLLQRPPSSFGDFASAAMRNAPSFIPGVGPAMQAAMPGGAMPFVQQAWPSMFGFG